METNLENAFAVQIAAVDRRGGVIFNEYVQPNAVIASAAVAVHGITPKRVASAATFAQLLPALIDLLHGRTVVAYKMDFDRGVFERELVRHHGDALAAGRCSNGWPKPCPPTAGDLHRRRARARPVRGVLS